jgi:uncharacterized membrane protein
MDEVAIIWVVVVVVAVVAVVVVVAAAVAVANRMDSMVATTHRVPSTPRDSMAMGSIKQHQGGTQLGSTKQGSMT